MVCVKRKAVKGSNPLFLYFFTSQSSNRIPSQSIYNNNNKKKGIQEHCERI
jgi:hypothetical protein